MKLACYLCVGQPGPDGCRRCGGTGVDPGLTGRAPAVGLAVAPLAGVLPGGLASAALVAGAVIGLLFLHGRHMKLAAAVLIVAAMGLGLGPGGGGGGPGGPLGPNAPVPVAYRSWVVRAGSICPRVTPALLAAQLRQESGFNPNARSNVGAQGIAQFMPATWASWSTDANGNGVASPWDPPDAITAQGRLMCALADRYHGRIDLVLAAYNAGPGAVDAAGGVPAIAETRRYVRAITAAAAGFTGS